MQDKTRPKTRQDKAGKDIQDKQRNPRQGRTGQVVTRQGRQTGEQVDNTIQDMEDIEIIQDNVHTYILSQYSSTSSSTKYKLHLS